MEQKWANKLNNDEFNLITDTWYPVIKKNAMAKVKEQLLILGAQLQDNQVDSSFKISAGENYQDLPYLVLDFPKIAGKEFPYVFRTFFWWGRAISYQLLVRTNKNEALVAKLLAMSDPETFILVGEDIWENDFRTNHFKKNQALSAADIELVSNRDYTKLIAVFPIKKPEYLFEQAIGFYEKYKEVILTS